MKKLILGIIAVSLLQIAFFLRTATPTSWIALPPVTLIPVPYERNNIHVLPSVEPREEDSASEKSLKAATKNTPAPVPETRRDQTIARANVRSADPVAHATHQAKPITRTTLVSNSEIADARVYRTVTPIPSGSTMVLVDYPSQTYMKSTAKERRKSEKRSFVAKVFSPLVKKPWNFLKAVASKLN